MSRLEARATGRLAIENGRIVTPDAVVEGGIVIEEGRIQVVEEGLESAAETRIDAAGRVVMPGIVDLHGDDVENHLFPRSGARMRMPIAVTSVDRSNVAAGITTKFHALSFRENPDKDRSPELAAELIDAIETTETVLGDHRIHARCEISDETAVEAVAEVIDRGVPDLVSVMTHIPGKGQFREIENYLSYHKGRGEDAYERAKRRVEEAGEIDHEYLRDNIDRIVDRAQNAGIPVASHDDESAAEVERIADRGVGISEFPITMGAAKRADELDVTTVMGAPNLVRGESQWGNLGSRAAIDEGLVDVLVADYHPPSMLAAAFVDTGEPLYERVARLTATPADAVGLEDRGRIESGARADLLVVDADPTPVVEWAFVDGSPVYRTGGDR
ncbi:alpha-D-ribose 1-methylphosphonate 5-triphosphate diphosphatase [Natrialba swarupiae]|uniref:Alpha-D-ribose 1-methylphosphonate 5-triphosphate diphosphatase n=1 Tax=Natrialba swarupiae TaxID=2448032 RepID=A0A5D5APB0_9EURY|nr:alpha-D-ribose 1-methylphosphonate 5-triphosphate diphosphatase [Natrialba swarupiae]TYT62705.1 alpha-D-ribose 1-methylphosphonate 5-triphosphate diphosphatase [Natrialba swarupiae]